MVICAYTNVAVNFGFGAMNKGNAEVVKALELRENEQIYGQILLGYPKK